MKFIFIFLGSLSFGLFLFFMSYFIFDVNISGSSYLNILLVILFSTVFFIFFVTVNWIYKALFLRKFKPAVIFLTGLSGAGKTTIANALTKKYFGLGIKVISLDGDEIRRYTRANGFDEDSRKIHNLNVGSMAALLESQGHIVIVSLISPYSDIRDEIRKLCENMIEVYVKTDIDTCIERDPKGLYKKAIAGEIKDFTGISAPYFPPLHPEITLNTASMTVIECRDIIFNYIHK